MKRWDKYLAVFRVSFEQEFVYRVNFIMWRLRNVMQFFLVFFLWDSVFNDPGRQFFGYDRPKILTYVFGILIIKAIVYSSRSIDVSGDIARGDLSNFLLKPISYFKYWFTRDASSKALNLIFAFFETIVLYVLLRPPFFVQTNPLIILFFLLSIAIAILLHFSLILFFSMIPFWYPEQSWATMFLFMIFSDFLGGGLFPLDIMPQNIQRVIYLTPFPHMLFTPLQIYIGKYSIEKTLLYLGVGLLWILLFSITIKKMWKMGLRQYRAEGR
jgi:ABC-2 type transport system permease protein